MNDGPADQGTAQAARDLVERITDQICEGVEPSWTELLARHPAQAAEIGRLRRVWEVESAFRTARPATSEDAKGADRTAAAPRHWGPLRLLEPIGRGAFGTVWRAHDPILERDVALKLSEPTSAGRRERILDEGRRLARIDHPAVVRVHGAAVHGGQPGIWMDLADGRTLEQRLRQDGRFAEDEAIAVGRVLVDALAAVHAAGVVHGDLKAANVLRRDGGALLLGDFGSALDPEDEPARPRSASPIYAAPEVLRGEDPDPRSDLYSLGVLLYHLLTGSFPVEGSSVEELLEAHAQRRTVPLRARRAEISAPLADIIERALTTRDERWQRAVDLSDALGALTVRPLARATRRPGLRTPLVGLLVVAVLAAAWFGMPFGRQFAWRLLPGGSAPAVDAPSQGSAPDVGAHEASSSAPPTPSADPLATPPPPIEALRLGLFRRGVDTALGAGDPVRLGDALHLRVSDIERPLWLYVVNQDSEGRAYVLFPLTGVQPDNPLAPGDHRLPGAIDGVSQDWIVTSEGRTESFLFVASHEPLEELERALGAIREASGSRLPDGESFPFPTRGVGGLGDAAPDRADVLSALEQIARDGEVPVRAERLTLVGR